MPDEITIPEHNHALLQESFFGVLTTIRAKDGLLSSNPVGFVWDGQHIRISTLKSRLKCQNLAADDRVAFCVVSRTNIMDYVEIRGHASLQDDEDCSFFRRQFMAGSGGAEPPEDLDAPGAKRVVITIHPQQVSSPKLYGGRFG